LKDVLSLSPSNTPHGDDWGSKMGANFETMVLPGDLTPDQVLIRFDSAQDQDRYENGHSYSGGFGMASGLTFTGLKFESREAAEDHLDEACKKWEAALAVQFTADGHPFWMISALCAC
jgi:hypothetical protein